MPNDDPLEKNTVDHIDGNKQNNDAENLRWLSLSDNVKAYYNKIKGETEYAKMCGAPLFKLFTLPLLLIKYFPL